MCLSLCHWVGTLARILLCWSFPKSFPIILVSQCSCGWTRHRGTSSTLLAHVRSCSVKMLPPFSGCSQQLARGLSGMCRKPLAEMKGRIKVSATCKPALTDKTHPSWSATGAWFPLSSCSTLWFSFHAISLPHSFPGWGMHPPVHKGKCSSERVKRFMLINPDCLFP